MAEGYRPNFSSAGVSSNKKKKTYKPSFSSGGGGWRPVEKLPEPQKKSPPKKKPSGGGTVVTAPRRQPSGSTGTAPRATSPARSSSSGRGGSKGGSGGGGSYASYTAELKRQQAKAERERKQLEGRQNKSTRQQADALKKLLGKFDNARDIKLRNVSKSLKTADAALLKSYRGAANQLVKTRKDNEKAESASSFANISNLTRERGDLKNQAASLGAGESDLLRSQLQAVRNWDANQSEVNRSYFDTLRTINTSITDLTNDTRTSRINLVEQANSDREQIWGNYYNQMADTWTQIQNVEGSNTNEGYKKKYKNAGKFAAGNAGKSWKSPGVGKKIKNWDAPVDPVEGKLNNTRRPYTMARMVNAPVKRPEGASLRKW